MRKVRIYLGKYYKYLNAEKQKHGIDELIICSRPFRWGIYSSVYNLKVPSIPH